MSDRITDRTHDTTRRDFVRAAALGAAAMAAPAALAAETAQPAGRQLYELRQYQLRKGAREKVMADYFKDALVPALRRAGAGPVGVFNVAVGPDAPTTYVLIPYPSAALVGTLPEALAADAEYQQAGAAVLGATADAPAYERVESSLMLAFASRPAVSPPPQAAAGKPRMFELRRYESHNERANAKKVEMFDLGEADAFQRAGLHGVFFGRTLVGARVPNLTYLLAFDDMADHDAKWKVFASDPQFRAMIAKPEYSDAAIVSSISNVFLRPGPGSQI